MEPKRVKISEVHRTGKGAGKELLTSKSSNHRVSKAKKNEKGAKVPSLGWGDMFAKNGNHERKQ